ncbi:YkgJ family cysteine cluster protein [Basfia succiniciproducens]|uniref:YkgJ family cysteine cluster protein n=1 Tax=Basfia succiniciproducens TaxID=653940 RepID=UPI0008C6791F|nr:YkgJ family cysteine cluster protein [Basfia succiniciproducens]SEP84070.1 hypothetical protein SAMN02910415_00528 [Basfia succiniciproducens]
MHLEKNNTKFPCNTCGQCCKNIRLSEQTAYLDRGDGICRHFDALTHLCTIYETRPLVCRVEDYYKQNLSHIYEWDEFIEINLAICEQLQEDKI